MSRKREVKNEIKKLEKLMKTISSLRSALQLMIREAPGIQKVVLILGGSPLRPQNAYELLFTQRRDHVLGYEGDFAKSKAAEALSKKVYSFSYLCFHVACDLSLFHFICCDKSKMVEPFTLGFTDYPSTDLDGCWINFLPR